MFTNRRFAALIAILSALAGAGRVQAATLTRGPYLQSPTPTSVVVRWRTGEETDSVVLCGTQADNLNLAFQDATLTTEHLVILTNLQPETKYFYATKTSAGSLTSDDPRFIPEGADNYFITSPPPGTTRPTRIWFVSDYGYADEAEISVRDSFFDYTAATGPAQVWLTGGDNDQRDGSDANAQESIFGTYGPLLRKLAIWPALGNHDAASAGSPGLYPYFDNFTFPVNGEAGGTPSGSAHYFSFDYGDIHFICLDSINAAMSSSPDTAMFQWLRADLAETTRKWKIAYWHGPPYTKGSHDSDNPYDTAAQLIPMRENALPILEEAGVDLILCGHSHVYERSTLLQSHYGYSYVFNETNKLDAGNGREDEDGAYRQVNGRGTVYVVAAVGGNPMGFRFGQHPAHLINIGTELGSCFVDINNNRLDFKFINYNTTVLDYFTVIKDPPLRITRIWQQSGSIHLSWTSVDAQTYRVHGKTTLDQNWQLLADPVPSQGTITTWSHSMDSTNQTQFFKISTAPPLAR